MEHSIFVFILVGFIAQIIDGALGMAYGVSSTTFLLSVGIPPAVASASVHMAEVFTTAISGFSHFRLGNVDKQLFMRLVVPGALGGVLGAYVLTSIPGSVIQPFVSVYLLVMGIIILRKALQKNQEKLRTRTYHLIPLGMVGGFFDAIGGGGWGTNRNHHPDGSGQQSSLHHWFRQSCRVFCDLLRIGGLHSDDRPGALACDCWTDDWWGCRCSIGRRSVSKIAGAYAHDCGRAVDRRAQCAHLDLEFRLIRGVLLRRVGVLPDFHLSQ